MSDEMNRRKFLKASSAAVVSAAGVAAASGTAAALSAGDSVWTTEALSVREGPGTGYARKSVADQYTGGYVHDGPRYADGYEWWDVRFNEDSDDPTVRGWVAGNWLTNADFSYPATGTVTSTYYDSRSGSTHGAVDIANDTGTAILAARAGTVSYVYNQATGCGKGVIVDHGGGWQTQYCHMSSVWVSPGQSVGRYDQLGEMGSTGSSTGPHLHFAILYDGSTVYVPPSESFEGSWYLRGTGVPKNYF